MHHNCEFLTHVTGTNQPDVASSNCWDAYQQIFGLHYTLKPMQFFLPNDGGHDELLDTQGLKVREHV